MILMLHEIWPKIMLILHEVWLSISWSITAQNLVNYYGGMMVKYCATDSREISSGDCDDASSEKLEQLADVTLNGEGSYHQDFS